jgi:mRNA interferase RelE/StbE
MTRDKSWSILVHRDAEKILRKLDSETFLRIRAAINQLGLDPRPVGHKRIMGTENLYRIRVGEWRISYALEKGQLIILIVEISTRGDAYRKK